MAGTFGVLKAPLARMTAAASYVSLLVSTRSRRRCATPR